MNSTNRTLVFHTAATVIRWACNGLADDSVNQVLTAPAPRGNSVAAA